MKLNKKGYMLVEIVIAAVLAFSIAFYLLNLTYKFKNTNYDIQESRAFLADKLIITKNIMNDIERGSVNDVLARNTFVRFNLMYDECDSSGCKLILERRQITVKKMDNGKTQVKYGKGRLQQCPTKTGYDCVDAFVYDTADETYFEKELSSALTIKSFITSNKIIQKNGNNLKELLSNEAFTQEVVDKFGLENNIETMLDRFEEMQEDNVKLNPETSILTNIRTNEYFYAKLPMFSIYSEEDYGINIASKRKYRLHTMRFLDGENVESYDSDIKSRLKFYLNVDGESVGYTYDDEGNLTYDKGTEMFCWYYDKDTEFYIDRVLVYDETGGIASETIIDHSYKMNATSIQTNYDPNGLKLDGVEGVRNGVRATWGGSTNFVGGYQLVDNITISFYFETMADGGIEYKYYAINGNNQGNNTWCSIGVVPSFIKNNEIYSGYVPREM